jgi:hypothetical protein
MEFLGGIADSSVDGKIVRLPPVLLQLIAADDVTIVAEVARAPATNRRRRVSGSETITNEPNDSDGGVRCRYSALRSPGRMNIAHESPLAMAKTGLDSQVEDQWRVVGNTGKALLMRVADWASAADKPR